jgi:uncharacterized membrane protein
MSIERNANNTPPTAVSMGRQSLWNRFGRDLLVGLAFFLPLALLAFVLYGLSTLFIGIGARIYGILDAVGVEGPVQSVLVLAVLIALTPIVLTTTGVILRHRYGERVGDSIDRLLTKVPGVGPIYGSLRRSRRVVLEDGGGFRDVVSLELSEGVDVLAFVVGRQGGADWTPDDERVTVYVPLSPNPTLSGHLLAVCDDRVTETSMTVRAALTVLVTVGTGEPEESEPPLTGLYRERVDDSDSSDGQ